MRLDVQQTWALSALVVLARATKAETAALFAARVCHALDFLLLLSPAHVCVIGAGVSRSAAAERGEVLVLMRRGLR